MGNIIFTQNEDGTVDAIGKQGSTWAFKLKLKDNDGHAIDLTGYTGRGQIRKRYSSSEIIKSFTVTIDTPEMDGEISCLLAASETEDIPCGKTYRSSASKYVYDIEIESSANFVMRLIQGKLFVDPETTK
jgi:hypothetical protein